MHNSVFFAMLSDKQDSTTYSNLCDFSNLDNRELYKIKPLQNPCFTLKLATIGHHMSIDNKRPNVSFDEDIVYK